MPRVFVNRLRAVLLVPLVFPLLGALNTLVEGSRNVIMPDGGSIPAGATISVKKGEIFYRQPLGQSHAVNLTGGLTFSFLGQSVNIREEDQLTHSEISGLTSRLVSPADTLYCTAAKQTGKKRIVGMSELFGLSLDDIAKLRHVQIQNCVIDTGSDGTANSAFVADTSYREKIRPVDIAPTAIRKLGLTRMPGESEARMMFDGPVGIIGNMSMSLSIVEGGKPLSFGNGQTLFRGVPHSVEALGGSFTILSWDRKAKTAQIRVDRQFAAAEYGVTTELRSR